eukprot:GHRQ01034935.1.p2 GENE.GHRQ01034935.1~~GHRQ01034935.1.p2  ORF type:complete len:112 (-),score=25.55 GHRQ01034935.1:248-583(-)
MVTKSLPKNTPAREARQQPPQQQEQEVAHAPSWAIPKHQHLLNTVTMKLQRNVQARLRLNGAVAAGHAPGWLFAQLPGTQSNATHQQQDCGRLHVKSLHRYPELMRLVHPN